ncbi:cAMP-specific phosphodiesterase [Tritrichomonas foetus]|uniref:cAMP-specific phosphodiesterase n=1 Tax=Tritrichomonas foetus TaxID=1144522 RepID=A0A1J4KNZ0_9EUKA|nr:cAMP-specific phosphodiesterase [Tritrichomonas foetus]|eukprot:OHT13009.1 cAMP-specific phosphodiesterase [Tritrichomonas foetus]
MSEIRGIDKDILRVSSKKDKFARRASIFKPSIDPITTDEPTEHKLKSISPKKPSLPLIPQINHSNESGKVSSSSRASTSSFSTFKTTLAAKNVLNKPPPAKVQPLFGPKVVANTPDRMLAKAEEDLALGKELDDFFLQLSHESLHAAIESFIQQHLNAGQVIFWHVISSIQRFYSYRLNLSSQHNAGLLGYAFQTRAPVVIPIANKHEWYDVNVDGLVINATTSLVIFPLFDSMNNLIALVEVSKKANDANVSKADFRFIEGFQNKFRVFSHWILQFDEKIEYFDLLTLMEIEQFTLLYKQKMSQLFDCREAEIWVNDVKTSQFYCYGYETKVVVEQNKIGVVGSVFNRQQVFNCYVNNLQSSYNSETDGKIEEPILAISHCDPVSKTKYVIMIRGQKTQKCFTSNDEERLTRLAPFIFSSFINTLYIQEKNDHEAGNEKFVESLIRVLPKVNQKIRPQDVLETAMKELKSFSKADRVTYYEIDREKNVLSSLYLEGFKDRIQVPIGKGHCGIAALRGKVLNTADAYEDKYFDNSYDKYTQYKTKSLLSVPIINTNGAVGSLIQLLNKKDSKPFSLSDTGASQIFGTVCTCLLTTSTLLAELNDTSRRLDGMNTALDILAKNENIYNLVVENCRSVLQCEYVTFYTSDEAAFIFHPIATTGKKVFADISSVRGIAAEVKKRNDIFYTNDVKNHEALAGENEEEKRIMISLIICPICSKKGKVIGILRALNKRGLFDKNDCRSIQNYARLISLIHDDEKIRRINEFGAAQIKMDKWINISENGASCIPQMLRLSEEQKNLITTLDFSVYEWNNNGLFQIIFHGFGSMGILTRMKLENNLLYAFLFECKQEYLKNNNSFHNWHHAVERMQFLMYLVETAKLDTALQPRDHFALAVATIAAFISHNGTNNRYHVETETPFGVSLPSESTIEIMCIMKLISLMSQEKTNLMHNMTNEDKQYIWKIIIMLMKNSDINKESDLLLKAAAKLKQSTLDMTMYEDRWAIIFLLFRASLCSTYCRPFLISQKWHDLEIDEMLHLGDLEEKAKLPYSSPNHCREIVNKTEHALEVLQQKVIPLMEVLSKGFPDMKDAYSIVLSNFKTWEHLKNSKSTSSNQFNIQ